MHQSFYIVGAPLGEEDKKYLLDEIFFETDFDDIPWEDEEDTYFQVNMEREEA